MDKKLFVLMTILVAFSLIIILFLNQFVGIEGSAIKSVKKVRCLNPKIALKYINEYGCERIYEDPKCTEQGKVEVICD